MRIFIYGTLLHNETLKKALRGYLPEEEPMVLPNFKERIVKGYPTLEFKRGESVSGRVFNLNQKDVDLLDKWESRYKRRLIFPEHGNAVVAYILEGT